MSDFIASDLSPSEKDAWATPNWLFNAINVEFSFSFDACANELNTKCPLFIPEEMNALSIENWASVFGLSKPNSFAWVNPPYSRGMIKSFIDKAYEQCVKNKIGSVLLVPATPDANWWPENATEIRFIVGGRISFVNPITHRSVNGNTKGSALVIFNPNHLHMPMVTRYVKRDSLRALADSHAE